MIYYVCDFGDDGFLAASIGDIAVGADVAVVVAVAAVAALVVVAVVCGSAASVDVVRFAVHSVLELVADQASSGLAAFLPSPFAVLEDLAVAAAAAAAVAAPESLESAWAVPEEVLGAAAVAVVASQDQHPYSVIFAAVAASSPPCSA